MQRHVSLREANQHLSRLVKAVEEGEELIITRRGKPVARLSAVDKGRRLTAEQQAALGRIRQHTRAGRDLGGRMPSRDELHER